MSIQVSEIPTDVAYRVRPSEEDIAQAKQAYEAVHALELVGEGYEITLLVRPLSVSAHRRMVQEAEKKGGMDMAIRNAFIDSVLFPQGEALHDMMTRLPSIPASAMDYIQQISGAARNVQGKRL